MFSYLLYIWHKKPVTYTSYTLHIHCYLVSLIHEIRFSLFLGKNENLKFTLLCTGACNDLSVFYNIDHSYVLIGGVNITEDR